MKSRIITSKHTMPRGREAKHLRKMKREMTSESNGRQKRFQSRTLQLQNKGKRITVKDISDDQIEVEDYLKVFQEMSKMANKQSDKEADRFCKKLGGELQ